MHDVDEFASSSKHLEKCRIKSLANPHDYSQSINVLYSGKLYVRVDCAFNVLLSNMSRNLATVKMALYNNHQLS